MFEIRLVIGVIFSFALLSFHIWCLTILCRRKNLRSNRFNRLLLFLSLSDAFTGIEFICTVITRHFTIASDEDRKFLYLCNVLTNTMTGTLIFSIYQTLQICLQQLNATFVQKKRILNMMTSTASSVIGLGGIHVLSLIRFCIDSVTSPPPCNLLYTATMNFYFTGDFVSTLLMGLVIGCCGVIIIRLRRHNRIMKVKVLTDAQKAKHQTNDARMKKNMITLIVVIALTSMTTVPRQMCLYVYFLGYITTENLKTVLEILAITVLINPLCDPLVFLLRNEMLRKEFKCKCLRRRVGDINTPEATNFTAGTSIARETTLRESGESSKSPNSSLVKCQLRMSNTNIDKHAEKDLDLGVDLQQSLSTHI